MQVLATRALVAILALALLARLAAIVATPDFTPLFDAADFHRHADSLASGDGYPEPQLGLDGPTAFRPPLYPLALAAVQVLGGGYTAERLLGALLGVGAVLLLYLIARRLWGERTAIVAGAIAAVFPPLVFLSATLLSEVLFIPLVLAAVLAVLHYRDDRRLRWALTTGVICGLAVLTRTNGLPIVLALAAGTWVARPRFKRASLLAPVLVIVGMAVTLSPWVIRNAAVFDDVSVGLGTSAGYALAGTYNDEARNKAAHPGEPYSPNVLDTYDDVFAQRQLNEAEMIGRLDDRASEWIRDNPGYVVETVLWNVPRMLEIERRGKFQPAFATQRVQAWGVERIDSPVLSIGPLWLLLVLAPVGIVALVRAPRGRPAFVWAVPILLALPALAIYGLARYRVPIDPFIILLASAGIVFVYEGITGPRPA